MRPQQIVTFLVYCLPVLGVAFVVLIGAYALTEATQDTAAARVIWWIAMSLLMLIVTNVVLLVGALGICALTDRERDSSEDHES